MGNKFFVRDKLTPDVLADSTSEAMSFDDLRSILRRAPDARHKCEYRREDSEHWRPIFELADAHSESDLDELVKQPFVYQRVVVNQILLEKPITEQEKSRYAARDAARAAAMQESSKSESVAIAVIAATVVIILLILLLQRWYL